MKCYRAFTLWTLLSVNSAAAVVDTDVIDNVASSEAIHNKASNLRKVKGGRTTASTTDENILHRNKDRALKSKSKNKINNKSKIKNKSKVRKQRLLNRIDTENYKEITEYINNLGHRNRQGRKFTCPHVRKILREAMIK